MSAEVRAGEPRGIGGWLVIYIVWACFGICFALYSNGGDLLVYYRMHQNFLPAGLTVFILTALFYGCYLWLLYRLLAGKKGAVRNIKKIILATPVFNAALPAIFALSLVATVPGLETGTILQAAYPAPLVGSIVGATVIALVWFRYFQVSRRVRNTWPEG